MVRHVSEIAMMRVLEHQDWGNLPYFSKLHLGRIKQTIANGKMGESKCSTSVMSVNPIMEHQDWGNLPYFLKCEM